MSLKIAVIGCGYMANDVHMPCILKYINEYGGLQTVGCADIDADKAKNFYK
jgi:predicted dehydrogenase